MKITSNSRIKLPAAHIKAIAHRGKHITPVARQYYDSPAGQWLHQAEGIGFKNSSIEPLIWVLMNKPEEEKQPLNILLLAISCKNPHIRSNIKQFMTPVSAYEYLMSDPEARKELQRVYDDLVRKGTDPLIISFMRMKPSLNRNAFTCQNNRLKQVSDGYFKAIVTVYLLFPHNFRNIDDQDKMP